MRGGADDYQNHPSDMNLNPIKKGASPNTLNNLGKYMGGKNKSIMSQKDGDQVNATDLQLNFNDAIGGRNGPSNFKLLSSATRNKRMSITNRFSKTNGANDTEQSLAYRRQLVNNADDEEGSLMVKRRGSISVPRLAVGNNLNYSINDEALNRKEIAD